MPRTRMILVVVLLVIIGVCGFIAVTWFTDPRAGPTFTNFQRLTQGMSRSQVEATLGPPAEVTEPYETDLVKVPLHLRWNGDAGRMMVNFSEDGLADGGYAIVSGQYIYLQRPVSLLETICDVLGL